MLSLGLTLYYILEFKRGLCNIIFKTKQKKAKEELGQACIDAIGVDLAG